MLSISFGGKKAAHKIPSGNRQLRVADSLVRRKETSISTRH